MALPLIESQPTQQYYDNILGGELENTWTDSASAAFEGSSESTIGGAIRDITEMKRLKQDSSEVVDPRVLNEKYRDTGVIFSEPTPNLVAEEIAKRARERNEMGRRIGTGPGSILQSMVNVGAGLGGGLYGSFTDPVDLGINVLAAPFVVGRLGLAAAASTRFGVLAAEGLAGTLARGAAEGAVTALASAPIFAYRDAQEQKDWGAMDFLSQAGQEIFTSTAFAGAGFGVNKLWKYMRRTDNGANIAGEFALEQFSAGKRPDVRPIQELFQAHMSGKLDKAVNDFSGRVHYKSSIFNPETPVSGKFYLAMREGFENAADVPAKHGPSLYSNDYGEGIYLSNDAVLANNVVASGFNESGTGGRVFEAQLNAAKLYDVDKTLSGNELKAVRELFDEASKNAGRDLYKFLPDNPKMADALSQLEDADSALRDKLNNKMREMGYDGYAFDKPNDKGDAQGIMLFKESGEKVGLGQAYQADASLLGRSIDDAMSEYQSHIDSPQSNIYANEAEFNSYIDSVKKMENFNAEREIEAEFANVDQRIKEMESQGLFNAEEAELIKQVREAEAKLSFGEKLIKAAMFCVGGS